MVDVLEHIMRGTFSETENQLMRLCDMYTNTVSTGLMGQARAQIMGEMILTAFLRQVRASDQDFIALIPKYFNNREARSHNHFIHHSRFGSFCSEIEEILKRRLSRRLPRDTK